MSCRTYAIRRLKACVAFATRFAGWSQANPPVYAVLGGHTQLLSREAVLGSEPICALALGRAGAVADDADVATARARTRTGDQMSTLKPTSTSLAGMPR